MKREYDAPSRELRELLSRLTFTHDRADSRSGDHWTVYAHPWVGEVDGYFDALISITARSSEAVTKQGLQLTVCRGNTTWLPAGATNQQGQVWFKQLPLGRFNVDFRGFSQSKGALRKAVKGSERADNTQPRVAVRIRGGLPGRAENQAMDRDAKLSQGAAPVCNESQEEPGVESRKYYLPDRRVVASLEADRKGRAVLRVETRAPELAGAVVRFWLGQETGDITLAQAFSTGARGGHSVLDQSFKSAEESFPLFELVLPSEQDKQ